MNEIKSKNKTKSILLLIFIVVCFAYLIMKSAQGAYESNVQTTANSNMAGWIIKINNTQVTGTSEEGLDLNYVVSENGMGKNSKAAPGSILEYPIIINTEGTDVSVRFDLNIIDKSIDNDKFLELKEISSSDITIIKTSESTYTGVIPKSKLDDNISINLKLEWPDDGTLVEYVEDTSDEDYFTIDFHAVQYRGEAITPYE